MWQKPDFSVNELENSAQVQHQGINLVKVTLIKNTQIKACYSCGNIMIKSIILEVQLKLHWLHYIIDKS